MMFISIAHTDVTSRMKNNYTPRYNYVYSYSKIISKNSYASKYLEMKREHKKVVEILEKANKTIENLEYRNMRLQKNIEYWKNRAMKKTNPSSKIKREEV